MTNLPISSNSFPLPGNTLNTAQTDLPADGPVTGLFAALLAQQTGAGDSLPPGNVQPVMAIDGIATDGDTDTATTKSADVQATITADTQGDVVNGLAAMLLPFPQEPRSHEPKIRVATSDTANIQNLPAGSRKTADIVALKSDSSANGKLDVAMMAQDKADAIAAMPDKHPILETVGGNTVKHMELAAVSTNTAQPLAPAGSRNAGNPQTIGTPLTSTGWPSEFSQKIVWMSTQQNHTAELHLNPPDLGPLNVSLKISDNQATALFTSPHGVVRDAIENALPKLRDMLADNGIMLGNATVSDQAPRDRSAEGFMNHSSGTNAHRMTGETPGLDDTAAVTQTRPMQRHNGMVDTFA